MGKLGERSGVFVMCEWCGKEVYKTLSQYNKRKHHFCSNKCQSNIKRQETFEYRDCETCGKSMYVSKKSTQRFCSIDCQSKWQTTRTGAANPKYDRFELSCDYCGAKYYVPKYRLHACYNHFCSKSCREQWYREVWSQRDDWKEESRVRAAKMLKHNATTNTKPQRIVNDILHELDIDYTNEEQFEYYSIDNYLPAFNLAIEVMGDFWHCNRIVYSEVKYANQADSIRRDRAKRTYMMTYHGVHILYLWECDIYNRKEIVGALIQLFVDKRGELHEYNSVNYDFDECGEIVLSDSPITMYQDMETNEIKEYIRVVS